MPMRIPTVLIAAALLASFAAGDRLPAELASAAQPAEAKEHELDLGDGVMLKLVRIAAGKFTMGSPKREQEWLGKAFDAKDLEWSLQEKQHEVEITKPFYLGRLEVTRRQFAQFVREESYLTEAELEQLRWFDTAKPKMTWRSPGFAQGDRHPVVCVSWNDAMAFCRWLSRKTAQRIDLPTEAEWEYACRGGTTSIYHSGDTIASLKGFANIRDLSLKEHLEKKKLESSDKIFADFTDGFAYTSPTGSFQPNGYGLFDMHGNVTEWCKDWYGNEYYMDGSARRDPQGPDKGNTRVLRGGSWNNGAQYCRCAMRTLSPHSSSTALGGFRVVMR